MVSNYTQMLARRYHDKLDDDANEFIDFAVDGAKRMQALIHDLLQYARVGTRGKEFKPVPGAKVVGDGLHNLAGAIEESKAEIKVGDMPVFNCDAIQLAQVFQNLIGNAIKFRQPNVTPVIPPRNPKMITEKTSALNPGSPQGAFLSHSNSPLV